MIPLENLEKFQIILASQSPRRKSLLADLGINFKVKTKDTDESYPSELPINQISGYLAEKKAKALENNISCDELIITADTIVALKDRVLTKPADYKDAFEILSSLSGKKHQVITGVCILTKEKKEVFSVSTDVWFKTLSQKEIDFYIKNYKPFDKAGAYGIQEWIGYIGIYRIDGSYFNVMGLPVQQLYEHLSNF